VTMLAREKKYLLAMGLAFGSVLSVSDRAVMAQTPPPDRETALDALRPPPPVVEGEHDLGIVTRGNFLRHAFKVTNTTTSPLELSNPSIPCQCGVVTLPPAIPPGASGEVGVEADTVDMAGPVSIEFFVASNDPASPTRAFRVTAIVKPAIFAKPGYARYLYVLGEPGGSIKQRLWATDFPDLQVLAVRVPHDYLKTSFRELASEEKPAGTGGRQWEVEVGIGNDAAVGPLSGRIEIETNHPIDRLVRLPVSGFVRPTFAVTPAVARPAQPVPTGTGATFNVDVKNFATDTIEITGIGSKSRADLDATIRPLKPGRHYVVAVTLPKGLPVGPFRGEVRLATSSPQVGAVVIPIEATITE
jgi:Protein of unknown function (DUF1573)